MVANKYAGDIVLEMAGEEYLLRYDWDAIGKLVSELGSNFDQEIARAAIEMDMPVIAKALVIGLERHHPGQLTDKEIIKLSPPVVQVCDAVNRAITLAFHGTTEVPEENPPRGFRTRILEWFRIQFGKLRKPRTATA